MTMILPHFFLLSYPIFCPLMILLLVIISWRTSVAPWLTLIFWLCQFHPTLFDLHFIFWNPTSTMVLHWFLITSYLLNQQLENLLSASSLVLFVMATCLVLYMTASWFLYLNPTISDNYCPIALAPTLSKALEGSILLTYIIVRRGDQGIYGI